MNKLLTVLFAGVLLLPSAASAAQIITDPVTGKSFTLVNGTWASYSGAVVSAPVVTPTVSTPITPMAIGEVDLTTMSISELKNLLHDVQDEISKRENSSNNDAGSTGTNSTGTTPIGSTGSTNSLPAVSLGEQFCAGGGENNAAVSREVVINGDNWSYGLTQILPEGGQSDDWLKVSINPDNAKIKLPSTTQLGMYKYNVMLYKNAPAWGGVPVEKNKILDVSGETTLDLNCQ